MNRSERKRATLDKYVQTSDLVHIYKMAMPPMPPILIKRELGNALCKALGLDWMETTDEITAHVLQALPALKSNLGGVKRKDDFAAQELFLRTPVGLMTVNLYLLPDLGVLFTDDEVLRWE